MKFYHGGTNKLNFNGEGHSAGTGLWLTQNKDAAISYINPTQEKACLMIIDVDLSKCNLLTFDYNGKTWADPPKNKYGKTTDEIVRTAKSNGYDAIMFKNVSDMKGRYTKKFNMEKAFQPSTNIVITKPEQMKSVDGVFWKDLPIVEEFKYFNY